MQHAVWTDALVAQFPLPSNYRWVCGDADTYPHLWKIDDIRWVYNYNTKNVLAYLPTSTTVDAAYPVASAEEAIALIYNLVLFGESQ